MKNFILIVISLYLATSEVIEGGSFKAPLIHGASNDNVERLMETKICVGDTDGWEQEGNTIDGENANDELKSVALSSDGFVMAVGAIGFEDGTAKGQVKVYEWDGSTWSQRGNSIEGKDDNDFLGKALALSGDGSILAVGIPEDDSKKENAGMVQVYQFSNGDWEKYGSAIKNKKKNEKFGSSLELSGDGNFMVVGMSGGFDKSSIKGSFSFYQYDTSEDEWNQIINRENGGSSKGDGFGYFVDVNEDGTVIATINFVQGKVYVYDIINEALEQRPTLSDAVDGHISLSADGKYIATSDNSAATVQVHKYKNSNDSWVQIGSTIVDTDGSYVRLVVSDDDYFLAIAYDLSEDKVRVYKYDETDWIEYGDVTIDQTFFVTGNPLAFSSDGQYLAVNFGKAQVYQYCTVSSATPSESPSDIPSDVPSDIPSASPSDVPSVIPSFVPSAVPSGVPTEYSCKNPWDPLGKDIVGTATNDQRGPVAISHDGTIIVIGTSFGNPANKVFQYNEGPRKWEQIGSDITTDIGNLDGAITVAISTEGSEYTLALGNPYGDNDGVGSVQILTFNGEEWIKETNAVAGLDENFNTFYGSETLQSFGVGLAFSKDGMSLVVSSAGPIFIYTKIHGFGWLKTNEITVPTDDLGSNTKVVAISSNGKYIAIGNPTAGEKNTGDVHVYTYGSNGLEVFDEALIGPSKKGTFGSSVALEGVDDQLILAIGSYNAKVNGNKSSGYISVLEWNAEKEKWKDYGDGDILGNAEESFVGTNVALSEDGRTVAFGDFATEEVLVYTLDDDDKWEQEGNAIEGGEPYFLSMSADGDQFAIGYPFYDTDKTDVGKITVMGWCEEAARRNFSWSL